ncbi:hypothetical protein F5884DRAFT_776095 [Xylogone sp. PMI_703]|nr:hypothetical protein F5884DRAFT_776095 [Xylogone sp. PMI_703]
MTSNPNATQEANISRDASANTRVERRPASITYSNPGNRYSIGSSETGESSTSARNLSRTSLEEESKQEGVAPLENENKPGNNDGRNSHRSHKNKSSGGFLLSNALVDSPPDKLEHSKSRAEKHSRRHISMHDAKGKSTIRNIEKRHSKRISSEPTKSGGSPLAVHADSLSPGEDQDTKSEEQEAAGQQSANGNKPVSAALDVDSAQIVNVALRLSESRRNAAKRNISTPLTPPTPFVEGFAGRSLRQTLQQQRRSSRTVSPKPDHGDRIPAISPRHVSSQKVPTALQSSFDASHPPNYTYHFSQSTLARAEKAKTEFELMAQYRRLLEFLPPLGSESSQRVGSAGGSSEPSTSPPYPMDRTLQGTAHSAQPGRPYNPLQYIRNRKVRARERRSINGEAQGFGDVEKVTAWVDDVENSVFAHNSKAEDDMPDSLTFPLPTFLATETAGASHSSPLSASKSQSQSSQVKRPRVDWILHAPDLLADLVWLEQDDNKRSIEDSHGAKIFPQSVDAKRPVSRRTDEPERPMPIIPVSTKREDRPIELRLDTKLPEFRSIKGEPDNLASRARHALHDATHLHHSRSRSHNRSKSANNPILILSPTRSDSDESDSDNLSHRRRSRSGTAESQEMGKNILEKQMMDILVKQNVNHEWDASQRFEAQTAHNRAPKHPVNDLSSLIIVEKHEGLKAHSPKYELTGRASLEVPGVNRRTSLEGFDSTAPNSPQTRPSRASRGFIPSIAIDLSPPTSRDPSPTRSPLSKVKSKLNKFREHSRERSRVRGSRDEGKGFEYHNSIQNESVSERPTTPDARERSLSPVKQSGSRKTEDSLKLSKSSSIKRGKPEETSGIKALFKGTRGQVNRVTDLIRKRDSLPGQGNISGFSTDDSDFEDAREAQPDSESRKHSLDRSNSVSRESPKVVIQRPKNLPSYLKDMPKFTSPFDHRGREEHSQADTVGDNDIDHMSEPHPSRDEQDAAASSNLLDPPRIDVQMVPVSADINELSRQASRPDSDMSELESRRGSSINAILGVPGRGGSLPVTGLTNLETSGERPSLRDRRQWSISDRAVSIHRGPMTKQEIARVRALLLSSGIKAKEITRRATEAQDLRSAREAAYRGIANLPQKPVPPVPKASEHILAARILQNDIQLSIQTWESAANKFCGTTMNELIRRLDSLQIRVGEQLIPMASKAGDEADEVSRDLVMNQTLAVKRLEDAMNKMVRRRRRKFRWLRRGGWVLLEWALVGVMWSVWLVVMLARMVLGIGRVSFGAVRWLFWL